MIARIAGVTLPPNKRIEIALTNVFGIGLTLARKILHKSNVDPNKRTRDLSEEEINKLRDIIENQIKVEGELKREILMNIKRLKEINTYRGSRHAKNLPLRGQRTKTNSRTTRGNIRRTMGSGRQNSADKK